MIRRMCAADVESAMRLKQAAGWNQTVQDWINVMALEPDGCWVWEQEGRVAGSTTAICYGRELAWIGMVLVLPEYRGQGIGRRLMEHALAWLEARGVRQAKLDATDMGRPLYEKLGFRTERPIERWGREGAAAPSRQDYSPPSIEAIAPLDREWFGADRRALLARLLETFPGQGVAEPGEGFCLGRPGSNAYFLGPCEGQDLPSAGRLIRAMMSRAGAQAYYWDLCPDVPGLTELARELGFERKRTLARMALRQQARPSGQPEHIFGAAGFEYG